MWGFNSDKIVLNSFINETKNTKEKLDLPCTVLLRSPRVEYNPLAAFGPQWLHSARTKRKQA